MVTNTVNTVNVRKQRGYNLLQFLGFVFVNS